MQGKLAISKSGHDKESLYIIIKEESSTVLLADGKIRTVNKPKRKNKKHIQVVENLPQEISDLINHDREFRNEEIKRVIKLYQKSACN